MYAAGGLGGVGDRERYDWMLTATRIRASAMSRSASSRLTRPTFRRRVGVRGKRVSLLSSRLRYRVVQLLTMRYQRLEILYEYVKRALLAAPLVGDLVRRRRAQRVEEAYRQICERYARIAEPSPLSELLELRAGDRLERLRALDRVPRVLFVGTVFAQDSAGILAGLAEVANATPFTTRDGSYGQVGPDGTLSFDRAEANGARLLDVLAEATRTDQAFDAVIGQMWGGYMPPKALADAKEQFGVVVVNIGMDDRHTFELRKLGRELGTRMLAPVVDLVATAAPEAVGWFRREGCPAMFFPEASDARLFRPDAGSGKRHDVCFVGARYGIRARVVERLAHAGIRVVARGVDWTAGPIATSDVPRLFAESRIVLGIGTVGHSSSLRALKLRDFDGPMSGTCYVTHDNPDLHLVYDVGREIAVYRDEDDAVAVVCSLLAHSERRDAIAQAGRSRAERDHTWERRFASLFEVLRGNRSAEAPVTGAAT